MTTLPSSMAPSTVSTVLSVKCAGMSSLGRAVGITGRAPTNAPPVNSSDTKSADMMGAAVAKIVTAPASGHVTVVTFELLSIK